MRCTLDILKHVAAAGTILSCIRSDAHEKIEKRLLAILEFKGVTDVSIRDIEQLTLGEVLEVMLEENRE